LIVGLLDALDVVALSAHDDLPDVERSRAGRASAAQHVPRLRRGRLAG